ncbi:MAG: alpha/beta hydrolase [Candidatus Woesearchaeota archaeon]|jgi:pimeloyl-ACP methyl ester carboxylesterase
MYKKTIHTTTDIYYVINRVNAISDFIIFIHGAGSNHSVYKPFFHAFEKHNFIAVDIRNHGNSGRCPLEYMTVDTIVQDILAIIREEKIQYVTLVGNSLGATVAVEVYKKIKKHVKKMVLFTLFSKRYVKFSSMFEVCALLAYYLLKPFSGIRKLRFTEYHKYAKRPIWYYPYLDIRGTPVTTVIKLVKELFVTPIYLSGISVPTLIFISVDDWCAHNSLIESDAKANPQITLLHIKSNHVILSQKYEEVISHVTEFLK